MPARLSARPSVDASSLSALEGTHICCSFENSRRAREARRQGLPALDHRLVHSVDDQVSARAGSGTPQRAWLRVTSYTACVPTTLGVSEIEPPPCKNRDRIIRGNKTLESVREYGRRYAYSNTGSREHLRHGARASFAAALTVTL